jgi:glycosyltransferase involved in cell wall biosynthesis
MTSICMLLQNDYEIDIRVRRKAEALVSAGYSVDVLALRGPSRPSRYTLHGVDVIAVNLGKKRGSLARYAFEYVAFFLWALLRVTVQMMRRRYSVVDVNTLPDFLVFATICAKWMGAKIVLDMHEITPEFYMSKYGIAETTRSIQLLTLVEKASFSFANHVITINGPIQRLLEMRGLPRTKCTIIMNTVDEERFFAGGGESAHDPVPSQDRSFAMMYHGTLTSLYGLDIAIEAFAIAHREMPGAELWILGDGPETSNLRDLAASHGLSEKVKLLGRVTPKEIPNWLRRCDVGILPIRRDVFLEFASPNKLAEFIVMRKPVIVSKLRAIQHYFSDHALAYCEPNDPSDVARQMTRLYQDSRARAGLVVAALAEYEPIRWEVMRTRYLALMARLTGAPFHANEQTPTAAMGSNS